MFAIPPRRGRAVVRAARGGRMWSRNFSSGGMVSAGECGAGTSVPAGAGSVGSAAVHGRHACDDRGRAVLAVRCGRKPVQRPPPRPPPVLRPLLFPADRTDVDRAAPVEPPRFAPARAAVFLEPPPAAVDLRVPFRAPAFALPARLRPAADADPDAFAAARAEPPPLRPAPFAPDFDPARFATSVRVERPAREPSPALAPRGPPRVPPAFLPPVAPAPFIGAREPLPRPRVPPPPPRVPAESRLTSLMNRLAPPSWISAARLRESNVSNHCSHSMG
jgi:hypothetical protein